MWTLKFFFDRKGKAVLLLTVVGWILTLFHLSRSPSLLFVVYAGFAFLITLIRFYPWYKKEDRGHGIEEHFEKTLVPTSYILVVTSIVIGLWPEASWPFLLFVIALFCLIQGVNFILLYFHFKDRSPLSPSYFVRSPYLSDGRNNDAE